MKIKKPPSYQEVELKEFIEKLKELQVTQSVIKKFTDTVIESYENELLPHNLIRRYFSKLLYPSVGWIRKKMINEMIDDSQRQYAELIFGIEKLIHLQGEIDKQKN